MSVENSDTADLHHMHSGCPLRLGPPCHEHAAVVSLTRSKSHIGVSFKRTKPAQHHNPDPPPYGLSRPPPLQRSVTPPPPPPLNGLSRPPLLTVCHAPPTPRLPPPPPRTHVCHAPPPFQRSVSPPPHCLSRPPPPGHRAARFCREPAAPRAFLESRTRRRAARLFRAGRASAPRAF